MTKKDNLKTKKSEWQNKCDEYLAGWKRAQADYDNLKKETTKEKSEFAKYANANLIIELLPILDNFKSAFSQIPENEKDSSWVTGFSYIMKQMEDFLKSNGVESIKTVGEKFDHNLHEAVEEKKVEEKKDGVILEEKRSGYKLHDKVIQVAKVVVNNIQDTISNLQEDGIKDDDVQDNKDDKK